MTNNLWPVNQILEWIDKVDKKFLTIKSNELPIILAIAKFCNSSWYAYPSVIRISNICLKDKKSTEDVLKRLALKKIILVKERFKKNGSRDTNGYTLLVDNLWGVGANSPLPQGRIYPYPRGESAPLTIQTTNHVNKKQRSSSSVSTQNIQSKSQMRREQKNIQENEEFKKACMPENLRAKIDKLKKGMEV